MTTRWSLFQDSMARAQRLAESMHRPGVGWLGG